MAMTCQQQCYSCHVFYCRVEAMSLLCYCYVVANVHGNVHCAVLVQDCPSVTQQLVQEVILLCKVHPVPFCAHVVCGDPGGGHCCTAGGLSLRWRKGLPRTPSPELDNGGGARNCQELDAPELGNGGDTGAGIADQHHANGQS